jgi:5'-nucleotidase
MRPRARALFDLREEGAVFDSQGECAYITLQRSRLDKPVPWGAAYPLVRGLLALNEKTGREVVRVILASRNDPESGMRMLRTIEAEGLPVSLALFTRGRTVSGYLNRYKADLFLSAESLDVDEATKHGIAAACIQEREAVEYPADPDGRIRIAFDGDQVLFNDEAEAVFQADGVDAFHSHERAKAALPLGAGPFAPLLKTLCLWQRQFDDPPVRTALVTARAVAAHARALNTLENWGINVDEAFFLCGEDKAGVLQEFGATIFFDDSSRHVRSACQVVPTGQVHFLKSSRTA